MKFSRLILVSLLALGAIGLAGCGKKAPPPPPKKKVAAPPLPPPPAAVSKAANAYNTSGIGAEVEAAPLPKPKVKERLPVVQVAKKPVEIMMADKQALLRQAMDTVRTIQTTSAKGQLAELAAVAASQSDLDALKGKLAEEAAGQEASLEQLEAIREKFLQWQKDFAAYPESKVVNAKNPQTNNLAVSVQSIRVATITYYKELSAFQSFLATNWDEFTTEGGRRALKRKEFESSYKQAATNLLTARKAYDKAIATIQQSALTS